MDPETRYLSTGHGVACHFAEQVEGSDEQQQATGGPVARATTPASGAGVAVPTLASPPSHPQDVPD